MINCQWCGTNSGLLQSNFHNCGGSLPLPSEFVPVLDETAAPNVIPMEPPLPPRHIPKMVINRMLFTDAGAVTGCVFLLRGNRSMCFFNRMIIKRTPCTPVPMDIMDCDGNLKDTTHLAV